MKKRNLKKGFTIVELVIVIAVIAILSAVLIPTFGGVVADAKEAALKADAKAIYTEYVADAAEQGDTVETVIHVNLGDDTTPEYYEVENGLIKDQNADGKITEADAVSLEANDKYYEDGELKTYTVPNA